MSDTTFANYPISVSEVKAYRDNDCGVLSPRDALIKTLREIDAGEINPDALVICCRYEKEDVKYTFFRQASPDQLITIGVLMRVLTDLSL